MNTQHTPTPDMEYIDRVREFASITRGESTRWKGDRILNGETYGFRIGPGCRSAACVDFPLKIKKGIRARAALAKAGSA